MDAPTRKLISIEEAQRLILARVERLPTETVSLIAEAGGRVLAGAAAGRGRPAPRSTARRWTASPCAPPTPRVGCPSRGSLPGARLRGALEPGEAMGIATGGVVPAGADAVIPFEYVVENDNT